MKKPWSVTTTLRNPERLIGFLKIINSLDGSVWDNNTQVKFQILLIQNREYGYGNGQFYNGLSKEFIDIIDDNSKDIPYEVAEKAFFAKNYEDPPMRGRQSINPLKKLGFVFVEDGKIKVTKLGKKLISGELDIGDAFLRCFLKWQIPNPASSDYSVTDGYNINPFVCAIHLINKVNAMEKERGNNPVGLSKREFSLFVPSLVNYNDIDSYVRKIQQFRDVQVGKGRAERKTARDEYRQEFAKEFLGTDNTVKVKKLLNNLNDYGDNAIRYFRLTRFIRIRGNGYYVDIEPRRKVEIDEILDNFTGEAVEFQTQADYIRFVSEYDLPKLPWETSEKKIEIAMLIASENAEYETSLGVPVSSPKDIAALSDDDLDEYVNKLRDKRARLQEQVNHKESQAVENLESYIDVLENIFTYEDRPILLEKFVTLGLYALNDAISIQPNYPVGDDNEPTFTAPAGVPDIECYYERFNAICEVTMLNRRDQWYNEGQPVMRHLREFEERVSSDNAEAYCLFIAPSIHRDTLNTFWFANKYEYEGSKQRIVPMTIAQFVRVLNGLLLLKKNKKEFSHANLHDLYSSIIDAVSEISSSTDWLDSVDATVDCWSARLNK